MMLTNMNIFRKAPRRSGGFTLIEILIVMGLMGVFVAVLLPDFNRIIPEMKVDKAAAKLSADLRLAQQKAVGEMSDVWFYIEPANNRYYAWVIDRNLNIDRLEDPLKGGAYLMVDFDELDAFKGAQIVSTTTAGGTVFGMVWYTPLGSVRFPGEDMDILLRHKVTGYQRTVHVTFPMGKISLP
jgi:prepilin-type N-terminal cleavage/methylation domain-containing protein